MITNLQLIDFCKKALNHPYWYGTFGQISSKYLYQTKQKQYPTQYQWKCVDGQSGVKPYKQLGVKVFDCVGLIKGAIWSNGDFNTTPKYNSSQDVSANGMRDKCHAKGISSIPDIKGVLVFKNGHVGVYIGDGYVIEAMGHKYGVVKTKLKERSWSSWGKCPWIKYVDEKPEEKPEEKPTDEKKSEYYKKYTGNSIHIDEVFSAVKVPKKYIGDYKKRSPVAKANGIKSYKGTEKQNIKLIDLAKKGKLKKVK